MRWKNLGVPHVDHFFLCPLETFMSVIVCVSLFDYVDDLLVVAVHWALSVSVLQQGW